MKILFVLLIFLTMPFIMLLKNRKLTRKELLAAESTRDLLRIEREYVKLVSQGRFNKYPCMKKHIHCVVHINSGIASNFCNWFDEFKVKPLGIRDAVKDENYKRFVEEYKKCNDEDIIKLFKQKDDLFFRIYSFKHPIRQLLWKFKLKMILLLAKGAVYILSLLAAVTKDSKKNTEIISDYKTIFGNGQIRIVS